MNRKTNLLTAIGAFARQRPGLQFGNYGSVPAYRAEARAIQRALREAETLSLAVAERDSITADDIVRASRSAYSGRLTITELTPGTFRVDYCTGQYFPTEYRNAVCAVLASALWGAARESAKPTEHLSIGDAIRAEFRAEFGWRLQRKWLD